MDIAEFWNNLNSEARTSLLVAVLPSLISIAGFWFTNQNLKYQTKELHSKYVDILVEKRLVAYHNLLKVVYYVGLGSHYTNGKKHKYSDKEKIEVIRDTLSKMVDWEQNSGAFFLLTQNSLDWFRHLENLLHKNPADTDKAYSQEQLNKIVRARNGLRTSLSEDLLILRDSENKFSGNNNFIQKIRLKFKKVKIN